MNTITIELCAEDRARLDAILDALRGRTEAQKVKSETTPETATEKAPEPTAEAQAAPVPQEVQAVKLTDIQSLVVQLATSGKKAEAREIVKAYAERVTELPADKYAEVYAKLEALRA